MSTTSGETWWVSTKQSKALSGRASRDTGPEMTLRRALHAAGLRYRVHTRIGERLTLDIDFTGAKVAVFVDGHYWHDCPLHPRPTVRGPNAAAWRQKFAQIDDRERRAHALLTARGYTILRYPECVVRDQTTKTVGEIARAVARRPH